MPLPRPESGEGQDAWLERCMGLEQMQREYPDREQRFAVCQSQWERAMKPKAKIADYYGGCEGPLGFPMQDAVAKQLEQVLASLDGDCRDYLSAHGGMGRAARAVESIEVRPQRREEVSFITTEALDLDREVLLAEGGDWAYFERNGMPVTWCHDYGQPPIGRGLWFKSGMAPSGKAGWRGATHYHERPEWYPEGQVWLPDVVCHYVMQLNLRGKSIGFVPLAIRKPTRKDVETRPWLEEADWLIAKWLALEWAVVVVQCNPDAIRYDVEKAAALGIATPVLMLKAFGLDELPEAAAAEIKGAIPWSVHGDGPKADEGAAWDGPREVAAADVEGLRVMCAWVDPENRDNKAGYKLPHHRAGGGHPVVWRGVAAAMAALMGGRGGVQMPSGDRRGVYNHLARHYKQFDKDAPEFKAEEPAIEVVTRPQVRAAIEVATQAALAEIPTMMEDTLARLRGRV